MATRNILFVLLGALLPTYPCSESDLTKLIGYTIVASKTIQSFVDEDGTSKEEFSGCQFGRKIIFTDNTYLTCSEYSYSYSYRPTAFIIVKNGSYKMIVDGENYDMSN